VRKRRTKSITTHCRWCESVSVPAAAVNLYVCLEDGWYTCVFQCPSCWLRQSTDADATLVATLEERGILPQPWSVGMPNWPILTEPAANYKPRRVRKTWLPFDEVDVVHLVKDMNSRNWFELLAAYSPHAD